MENDVPGPVGLSYMYSTTIIQGPEGIYNVFINGDSWILR